jgi:hypothetical protein
MLIEAPATIEAAMKLNTGQRSLLAATGLLKRFEADEIPNADIATAAENYGTGTTNIRKGLCLLKNNPRVAMQVFKREISLHAGHELVST